MTITGLGLTLDPAGQPAPVSITASASLGNVAFQSQPLQVSVVKPAVVLLGVTPSRTTLSPPESISAALCVANNFGCFLQQVNAQQTITFSITSNGAGVALSQATGTIVANASSTADAITISTPTQLGQYTVNATDANFATDATPVVVTVNEPAISSLNFGFGVTVGTGMQLDEVFVELNTPAPTGDLIVNLASTDDAIATVDQTSIRIPAGSQFGVFTVKGISTAGLESRTVQITASAEGFSSQSINVTVVQPVLTFFGVQTQRAVGGAVNSIGVQACSADFDCSIGVMSAPVTVTFSVGNTQIVTVAPTLTDIQAGVSFTTDQITISSPNDVGTYTITASAPGFVGASANVSVN